MKSSELIPDECRKEILERIDSIDLKIIQTEQFTASSLMKEKTENPGISNEKLATKVLKMQEIISGLKFGKSQLEWILVSC